MAAGSPKIAIIGAGPAGSTLARLLHLANISVVIYEAEASADVRTQGGTLDLHTNTGIAALKRCQLYDAFLKYCRYDGEAMVLADKQYRQYLWGGGQTKESKHGRPEIDRSKLRDILLESLPKEMVQWGKQLHKVDKHNNSYQLTFEDDSTAQGFDLIVGADGAFSKVRPLLSSNEPFYAGIGGVWGMVPDAVNKYPDLHKRVNKGSLFTFSDSKAIFAQQLGDGCLNVSAAWVRPQQWAQEQAQGSKDHAALKAAALKEYQDWDPRITEIFEAIDNTTIVNRNLYMLPVGHSWTHKPGLTLIGDAAHLMTPFAGEGVNFAMADSMKLAEAIIKSTASSEQDSANAGLSLDTQIKLFEEDMFKRAAFYQGMTKQMMDSMFFTPGAPYTSIEQYVLGALSDTIPMGTHWLCSALVHSFYFVYKRLFLAPTAQD